MANAKICIAEGTLNQKWWDEAIDKVGQNYDALGDYDREFYNSILDAQTFRDRGWQPTVKQFNYMRQIASRL